MNLDTLTKKFRHDQSIMQQALPHLPEADEYYEQFGDVANAIAGDYADRYNGSGWWRIGGYLLDLYRMTPTIPNDVVDALDQSLRQDIG